MNHFDNRLKLLNSNPQITNNGSILDSINKYGDIVMIIATIIMCAVVCIFLIVLQILLRKNFKFLYIRKQLNLLGGNLNSLSCFFVLTRFTFTSNEMIYSTFGIDTLVLLITIKVFLAISSVILLFNLLCIVPTNIVSNLDLNFTTVNFLRKISFSNIPRESKLMWVHFLFTYLITILIFTFVFFAWKSLIYWKQKHFFHNKLYNRSVLMQHLPSQCVRDDLIMQFLNNTIELDMNRVSILIFKNDFHLIKYIKEVDNALLKYSRVIENKKSGMSTLCCYPENEPTSTLEYHTYLESLNCMVDRIDGLETVSYVLLVFADIEKAHTLSVSEINSQIFSQNCVMAPEPLGILPKNLVHSKYTKFTLFVIVWIATILYTMFWTFPYALISSLTKSFIIGDQLNIFKSGKEVGLFFQTFLETFVPLALMMLFYLLLPYIMKTLSMMEGHVLRDALELSIFTKFSLFHIINTFFVFFISGSILEDLRQIIQEPLKMWETLADAIPQQANFFTQYIVFFTLVFHPFDMTQFIELVIYLFKKKNMSEFETKIKYKPRNPYYPDKFSRLIYIFGIGVTQCLMSPILTLVWPFYYVCVYFAYTYEEIYVNSAKYCSKGIIWTKVVDWITVYTIIFQLLMLGLFTLKGNSKLSAFIIPLPIITLLVHMLFRSLFMPKFMHMTLETLKHIPNLTKEEIDEIRDMYDVSKQIPPVKNISVFTLPAHFKSIKRSIDDIS